MNTLKNYLILYDAECPMCSLYTKGFINAGWLEQDGRAPYQQTPEAACPMVDRQLAVNEIALVNKTTGEVYYGIHSLFRIFAAAMPALGPVFRFKPLIWLMSKVYAFISYNRRVIIPVANEQYVYQPTFKLNYRIVYLLFTGLFTAYILTAYVRLISNVLPAGTSYREYMICIGQVFFQGIVVSSIMRAKTWAYLGNMMTISFGGALLLLPALLIAHYAVLPPLFYVIYFMGIAGLMLAEHIRRTQLLNLGLALTISWVCYRLLVILLIFLNK